MSISTTHSHSLCVYMDPETGEVRGTVPWEGGGPRTLASSKTEFKVHTSSRVFDFTDPTGGAQVWMEHINKVVQNKSRR